MAKDLYHDSVKHALIKQDWLITDDPLTIQFGDIDIYIDLGVEKVIAAEKDNQKIAIEIKTFLRPSLISQFHTAVGQYINYREALKVEEPERILFLAVPAEVYRAFFTGLFARTVIANQAINVMVYDPVAEEVVEWIA